MGHWSDAETSSGIKTDCVYMIHTRVVEAGVHYTEMSYWRQERMIMSFQAVHHVFWCDVLTYCKSQAHRRPKQVLKIWTSLSDVHKVGTDW